MKGLFSFLTKVFGLLFCVLIISLVYLFWGESGMLIPGLQEPRISGLPQKTIVIPSKMGLKSIGHLLVKEKLISHPFGFYLAALLTGKHAQLKAGEYEILPQTTPLDWVALFASGKTVKRLLTIPEGLTVAQVLEIVQKEPILTGDVGPLPFEGSLLPETYEYQRGEKRESLIQRMKKAMEQTLGALWSTRDPHLFFKTPKEALIFASIVEKETPLDQERPLVAGVFLNRLKKKMKLQSDPTVSYGLTQGKSPLLRALTYADLKAPSPFNTYVIESLPPTPIACPGKKSLEATFHPQQTQALYFVADGKGGHIFANTFSEHTQNVRNWRKFKKKKQQKE